MLARQTKQVNAILGLTQKRSFGAIQKAGADQKFLTPAASNKTMYFDGLKGTNPATYQLDNIYRHHNNLTLFK